MNEYETMAILHPDLGETGTRDMVQRIRTILESGTAEVRAVDEWGIRELAYTIEKQRRGYYVVVNYAAPPAAVTELERQLRLSDSVLRFLSIRRIQKKQLPPRRPRPQSESGEGMGDMA